MAWSIAIASSSSSTLHLIPSRSASPYPPLLSSSLHIHRSRENQNLHLSARPQRTSLLRSHAFPRRKQQPKREDEEYEEPTTGYKFPDPIPEFAEVEIEMFRAHLLKKFSKQTDLYGDKVDEVLEICTEIFSTFLHKEYGGPGTLLVTPFMDMAETLNGRGLPGSKAARTAVKWAQQHVDEDWKEWTKDDDDDNDNDDNNEDDENNKDDDDSD